MTKKEREAALKRYRLLHHAALETLANKEEIRQLHDELSREFGPQPTVLLVELDVLREFLKER